MVFLWIVIIVAVWEVFAFIVQFTKRTPVNILPHIYGIIESILDTKTINGSETALQMVLINAGATLSRAGIGFLIGTVLGFILALLMNLSGTVEKIAFPYLMLIQMIPVLGMAPIVLALTGDIATSRIVIAAILTFYPVAANTLAGFKGVHKEKHELMYSYAASKFQLYKDLDSRLSAGFFHRHEDSRSDGGHRVDTRGYPAGRRWTRMSALTVAQGSDDKIRVLADSYFKRDRRYPVLRFDRRDRKACLPVQSEAKGVI